jgi:hypothetical protein
MQEVYVNEEMAIELFNKIDALTLLLTVNAFLLAVLLIYLFIHFAIGKR